MPAIPEKIEALAREVASRVRSTLGPGVTVVWFGSWIDGTATSRSDIDVAVDAGRVLRPVERARLDDAIDAIETLRTIDVVDLKEVSDELRQRVLTKGRAL